MVTRGDQVLIPRGDFVFREGDVVAIVSTPPKANDFFKRSVSALAGHVLP